MSDHPIQGLMKTTMENLKQMVDANTIIGEAVESPDGSVIIPVSKVSFGFAAGGSDFTTSELNTNPMFGGGSGGGVSVTPVAFLVVSQHGVRSVPLETSAHLYDRILDTAPHVLEKVQGMFQQGQGTQQMPLKTEATTIYTTTS